MAETIHADSKVREAGFVMAAHHCHPYFELFYVETGGCRFTIENNMYDLYPGDFILIPPYVLHYTRYLFGSCKRNTIFFGEKDISESVKNLLPGKGGFFDEMRIFHVPEAYRKQISLLFSQMITEGKISDDFSFPILEMILQTLFLLCGRVCNFFQDIPAEIHTTDRQILTAAKYISENYTNPITTAEIAAAVGFSPNYLSKKFREAAGIGVHQYLSFIRLKHAAEELITTNDPITEIAFRCGFSDSNYFKDAFKKAYGLAPREYRKTH